VVATGEPPLQVLLAREDFRSPLPGSAAFDGCTERSKEENVANEEAGDERGHSGSTAVRAAAAAAVAGAASYGVRKALEHRDHGESSGEETDGDESGGGGLTAKKDDLAETLSTKASDVKKAAGKLVPRRQSNDLSSLVSSAWQAAAEQLLPFAGQAAAALGKTAAEKAPEPVRKELIPRFIEGFQRSS
jgi:hypothetical protein